MVFTSPAVIVVIGPESTGKSTLCNQLAEHYQTHWCPEYARQFLTDHGTHYTYQQLLTIAKGQLLLEDAYRATAEKQQKKILLADTDMYVMKVWCEYAFNNCHTWILNQIAERPYALYLLCKPDLPWVQDELREYPDPKIRETLFHYYRDLLTQQHTPWVEINGLQEQRVQKAIIAINQYLS